MEANIAPPQPRWYLTPKNLRLPVERIQRGPFPEEVAISIRIEGVIHSTFVPSDAVNEERKTCIAIAVGEIGDAVLVHLPPSSSGGTVLKVSRGTIDRWQSNGA